MNFWSDSWYTSFGGSCTIMKEMLWARKARGNESSSLYLMISFIPSWPEHWSLKIKVSLRLLAPLPQAKVSYSCRDRLWVSGLVEVIDVDNYPIDLVLQHYNSSLNVTVSFCLNQTVPRACKGIEVPSPTSCGRPERGVLNVEE